VVLLLALSQVLLPRLAALRIEETALDRASGVSVHVSAFPALELLFGKADRVTVHAREMSPGGQGNIRALLGKAASIDNLDVTVDRMYVLGLAVDDVSLDKDGRSVSARATVTRRAIHAVLPANISLLERQEGERSLRLTIRASVLGYRVDPTARLAVADGALEVSPELPLFSQLHLDLFSDPQVALTRVNMRASGERYTFTLGGSYA
jgi:LmeA-like phospholipid-binding